MCGRYQLNDLSSKKGKQLKERAKKLNLVYKTGEIFPNDNVLCIIPYENRIDLRSMKWGIKGKSLLINARVETLQDRISFSSISRNRCAVVCNGFYEWDKEGNRYYITLDDECFYLACIFNDAQELVILTKEADKQMKGIHERMPIIMNQSEMLNYVHNLDDIFKEKKLNIDMQSEEISLF